MSAKEAVKKEFSVKEFDKYHFYRLAVQSPETDVVFFRDRYRELNQGADPRVFREDFCATFSLCCEWVKLHDTHQAVGVDRAAEPLAYGKKHYLLPLLPSQQRRVTTLLEDVLVTSASADIICAVNFSYFYFKQRQLLKTYFARCLQVLNSNGILILDCFGGSQCYQSNEEETAYEDLNFSYYWDQDNYDPISNYAKFYIHFKRAGEKKRKRVFIYDWRLWSISEVRELLSEVGFKQSTVYWEGTDENGEGNGEFTPEEQGEECESWVCYIVGQK